MIRLSEYAKMRTQKIDPITRRSNRTLPFKVRMFSLMLQRQSVFDFMNNTNAISCQCKYLMCNFRSHFTMVYWFISDEYVRYKETTCLSFYADRREGLSHKYTSTHRRPGLKYFTHFCGGEDDEDF